MKQLEGKVALVTGGASGIGAACVETFVREGAQVVLTDVDVEAGQALAERVGGVFLQQDVTDEARWGEVVAAVEERFGALDVLVANAGIGLGGPALDMTLADFRRQMAVNVDGVFLSAKHVIPAMRRAGRGGSVIVMSSVAGLRGAPGLAGYSASKGAVRLLAKSLALECAGARDGVRVNSVHPGIIETPIWTKIAGGAIDPAARAATAVPLGVMGRAQDVAEGVLYLASDASRYVTGSELVIDGGMISGRLAR